MLKTLLVVFVLLSAVLLIFLNSFKKNILISPGIGSVSPFIKAEIPVKNLAVEEVFKTDHNFLQNYPQDKLIKIIATGDIIPARYINFQTVKRNNFNWPYEKTFEVLKNADLTFANLESPLIKNCPVVSDGMVFCGDEKNIGGLKFAGIDLVNLANNHFGNYGKSGVDETIKSLKENNIAVTGLNGAQIIEIKGIKFAFLGYNDVGKEPLVSSVSENKISKEISEAKKEADVAIVAFHWGAEYTAQPNQRQKDLAHLSIDSGADLIIGNHPHWIQPVEIYHNKFITYAHGNFIFDQFWSEKTLEGVIGKYTFYKNKLIDVEFLPIQIDNFGQPAFLEGNKKEEILNNMYHESLNLK
ncbi:MAG: CapA family protein [Candidatus Daviesbacteria bacterium]|nr:CapA family protein [Candidatus Daviesbacteria bacterium]